jgi:hypothetical protein
MRGTWVRGITAKPEASGCITILDVLGGSNEDDRAGDG